MTNHSFTFHVASEGDTDDILDVETRAFGYSKEARLVADLLNDESACPTLSLLARHNGEAVGHILFTRATFKGEPDSPMMHILAPWRWCRNTRAWALAEGLSGTALSS
jgi:predicted N-acetyltransferase YhbS